MKYFVVAKGSTLREFATKHDDSVVLKFPGVELRRGSARAIRYAPTAPSFNIDIVVGDGSTVFLQENDAQSLLDERGPAIIAVLPMERRHELYDANRGPDAILAQAIANLATMSFLGKGEQAVVLHFHDASTERAPIGDAEGRDPEDLNYVFSALGPVSKRKSGANRVWKMWMQYLDLRERLDGRGFAFPSGKLFSYLHELGEAAGPNSRRRLLAIIDDTATRTETFNYRPCRWNDAVEIARVHGVQVEQSEDLFAHSSLLRVFQKGQYDRDVILIRKPATEAVRTFLLLYELCHVLRDIPGLHRLPKDAPRDTILCLPPGQFDHVGSEVSVRSAEQFAMVGLLPTASILWELRDAGSADKMLALLPSDDVQLPGAIQEPVVSILQSTFQQGEIPSVPSQADWLQYVRRRITSAIRHTAKRVGGLISLLGSGPLSPDRVEHLQKGVVGAWVRVDNEGRILAASEAYAAILGIELSEAIGRSVLEFGDHDSKMRFQAVRSTQTLRSSAFHYAWRFRPRNGKPAVLGLLMRWPVIDGMSELGSFVVVCPDRNLTIADAPRVRRPGQDDSGGHQAGLVEDKSATRVLDSEFGMNLLVRLKTLVAGCEAHALDQWVSESGGTTEQLCEALWAGSALGIVKHTGAAWRLTSIGELYVRRRQLAARKELQ